MVIFSKITWKELADRYGWEYDLIDKDNGIPFMMMLTERAESLGYKIGEWTWEDDQGRKYGVIFRFFGMDEIDILFDDKKKDKVSDLFCDVHELRKKGSIVAKYVEK